MSPMSVPLGLGLVYHIDMCLVSSYTQVLGTPTEETWPGVTALPEFKKYQFKNYSKKELGFVIPEYVHNTIIACQ